MNSQDRKGRGMKYEIKFTDGKPQIEGDAESFVEFVEQNKANLSNANLSNANLVDADLSKANLVDANLHNADLSYANLVDADLRNANLRNANLHNADLSYANLVDADLSYANLRYANLRQANLRQANFGNANIDYTGWNLSCKTYNVTVDKNIASQIAMHFCWLDCDDSDVKAAQDALKPLAVKCKHWRELPERSEG